MCGNLVIMGWLTRISGFQVARDKLASFAIPFSVFKAENESRRVDRHVSNLKNSRYFFRIHKLRFCGSTCSRIAEYAF